jgi:membrane protease YdiL (CAAX protease family)
MQVWSPSFAIRSAVKPIGPKIHALEAGAVFALLISYIWYFQAIAHSSWMILLALVLMSHAVRGESPSSLGLRSEGFVACARRFAIPVLLLAAIGTILGFAFDTVRHVAAWRIAGVLGGYCFWALFQQYLLNGYFVNRLQASFDTRYQYLVAPMAGAMFAAAHVPNPLLMVVTLIGGSVAAVAYQRHRNLFFLALAHALIGTMLWLVVPDTMSHNLRVGPGMLRGHGHTHAVHRPSAGGGTARNGVSARPTARSAERD